MKYNTNIRMNTNDTNPISTMADFHAAENFIRIISTISILVFCFSCVDPAREYSPDLKHSTPGIEYMPDMYRSGAYEPNTVNPVFAGKQSAGQPVKGTIARLNLSNEMAMNKERIDTMLDELLVPFSYPDSKEGYDSAGKYLKNPLPLNDAVLAEGKRLFGNNCIYCHGAEGKGDGNLVQAGKYAPPPSYSTGVSSRGGAMKDLAPGKIYHTLVYGVNMMGSHAAQLNPEERWKVIWYVRQLQQK
ncbi:MAG: cytochrome c [Bacteroidetes bacterium]|nr:cytochrome c [Bacteroidota bacterium]